MFGLSHARCLHAQSALQPFPGKRGRTDEDFPHAAGGRFEQYNLKDMNRFDE
jgi:hypothetical protein